MYRRHRGQARSHREQVVCGDSGHFLCIPGLSVRPSNATLALMKNVSPSYLKHHFLIAMPHMADPNFAHTLTYIVEHTANGAMGLVVNRPQDLNLADILEQLRPDIEPPLLCQHVPIFMGGPVQTDRGFCPASVGENLSGDR